MENDDGVSTSLQFSPSGNLIVKGLVCREEEGAGRSIACLLNLEINPETRCR